MGTSGVPALPLAAGVLAGVALARWTGYGGALPGFALAVAAVLVGREFGRFLLAFACGWLAGVLSLPSCIEGPAIDPEQPVSVLGRAEDLWSPGPYGWRVRLRVERTRQGVSVHRWPETVFLYTPFDVDPGRGAVLRADGRLRTPVPLGNGVEGPRGVWRLSAKSARLVTYEDGSAPAWVDGVRSVVEASLERGTPPRGTAMARALLLGDGSAMPRKWLSTLRRAGLGHLLAVSGLHVGLLVTTVWLLCLWIRPVWRFIPCALAVGSYLVIVGPRPSLVRSALMVLVALFAFVCHRRPVSLNAWAIAVSAMAMLEPGIIERVDFQLTAAATLGLLVLAPRLFLRWRRLPGSLAAALAVSVAAHIATLPWGLSVFHQWTPGAVLLNLVAVPWTAITLFLSVLAVGLGWLGQSGRLLWWLQDRMVQPFGWLAELPPELLASWSVTQPWTVSIPVTLALAVAVTRLPVWLSVGLCLAGTFAFACWPYLPFRGSPQLVMLDVGQGEAVLLRDGSEAVLVDGGGGATPGFAARELAPALGRLGVRRLRGAILTHPDQDHCGGLLELSELVPIESLWSSGGWGARCYRALVARPSLRLRPIWAGESWRVGRWALDVVHPSAGSLVLGNERSLVVRAAAGDLSVLLTGDTGVRTESSVVPARGRGLASRVLKVGHHGSRNSTSVELLDVVQPSLGLISVGVRNLYGHPSPSVLERLASRGVTIYRTDLHGQIVVEADDDGEIRVTTPWRDSKRPVHSAAGDGRRRCLIESPDGAGRRHHRPDGRGEESSGSRAGRDAGRRDRQCRRPSGLSWLRHRDGEADGRGAGEDPASPDRHPGSE